MDIPTSNGLIMQVRESGDTLSVGIRGVLGSYVRNGAELSRDEVYRLREALNNWLAPHAKDVCSECGSPWDI
jgi:hypothetical protein